MLFPRNTILLYATARMLSSAMKTFIFQTKMISEKNISREVEVLESMTLYKFAQAIVEAHGFDFDHAFGFYSSMKEDYFKSERMYELFADTEDDGIEPTKAESVKNTKISHVWNALGDKMMFLFDYGDGWRFSVDLKAFGEKDTKIKYPRVLKSVGIAPEQYPDSE